MPSPRTRIAALCLSVVTLVVVSACGSSGRELRDYPTGQTAPPRNAPAAGTLDTGSTSTTRPTFSLSTDQWDPGGPMPTTFTCDGEDISPSLSISSPPDGTVELALVVTDIDAGKLVHWIVAGIPLDTTNIAEGSVPAGSVQAQSANDEVGWFGPCPPEGETHTYELNLHALPSASGVVEGDPTSAAVATIESLATDRSTLTATYRR